MGSHQLPSYMKATKASAARCQPALAAKSRPVQLAAKKIANDFVSHGSPALQSTLPRKGCLKQAGTGRDPKRKLRVHWPVKEVDRSERRSWPLRQDGEGVKTEVKYRWPADVTGVRAILHNCLPPVRNWNRPVDSDQFYSEE